jgi:hypothetical protein
MEEEIMLNTFYLVITDRYDPYEEELVDEFITESEAIDYAEDTAELYGVSFCKVLKVTNNISNLVAFYPGQHIKP